MTQIVNILLNILSGKALNDTQTMVLFVQTLKPLETGQ